MTAPIFHEKGYKLEIEIQKSHKDNNYVLKEMRVYYYDNVWAARNAYEKFFSDSEYEECDDKRIEMKGNEELMVLSQIYFFSFASLKEAEEKKKSITADYKRQISKDSFMKQEVEELEKRFGEKG